MHDLTIAPPSALHRGVLAAAALILGLLLAAPAAGAATVRVAPVKKALAKAYEKSDAGDVIRLSGGAHPAQVIPAGTKPVTLRAAASAKVPEIDNYADNVTFDGVDVDGGGAMNATFENHDASNVTFKNGRIGNVTDEKGAVITGRNFTFDNVVFHDVRATNSSIHNECIFALDVTGMTVRNSLFHNCATMDLFFTYGSWWSPLPPAYGKITLENNVFGHSTKPEPGSWHYYSLYVANTANGGGTIDGWTVRNNTFEIPANLEHSGSGGTRWVGNLGSWNCAAGITFRHNVGQRCSGSDKAVSPAASTQTSTAPFGWINPGGLNFRLKAGSPAIDAADPNDHPALDRDGLARAGRPDAGAHEYGGRRPGAGAPPPPPAGGGGPGGKPKRRNRLLRAAALRPRVICKRPAARRARRRGRSCPRVARVRVTVGRPARVGVRVKRLRRKGAPRVAKRRFVGVRRTRVIGIRARGLRRGGYRVVVRARTARVRSQPWSFRLLVR